MERVGNDLEFIGRGIKDVMHAPVRMAGPAFAEPRLRIHAEHADIARAPKLIEAGLPLRRSCRAKLVEPKAVGRIEIKWVVCRDAHGRFVSWNERMGKTGIARFGGRRSG